MKKSIRFLFFLQVLLTFSCTSINKIGTIENGEYQKARIYNIEKDEILKFNKPKVTDFNDSILIGYMDFKDSTGKIYKFSPTGDDKLILYKNSVDLDILSLPFKIRPSVEGFPMQLNSNFNAAFYLGKRFDKTKVLSSLNSFGNIEREIYSRGHGYGIFAGIGSTTMNPFVTRNTINIEYDGLIMNLGVAGIYDAKAFNLGIALGADHLFDKNRKNWIYQNKPWLGVLFGLNLN